MLDRRGTLAGAIALLVAGCARGEAAAIDKTGVEALRAIELRARGRLGATVLDPATGRSFGWRENERFAHCSSFKLSLAAMLLAQADKGLVDLDEVLRWSEADLLPTSPVTSTAVATGLPVARLAHATLVTSDNTAANVLLRRFGGPAALTGFWRSLGDSVSRLDRYELALNEIPPGTELDTTTPAAMAATVAKLIHGEALAPATRATLKDWMREVATGRDRLRAGFPAAWDAGDKTGTGLGERRHTYVDLAFGGPAGATPLVVAAYFEPERPVEPRDPAALAALADVGRVAAEHGLAGR